MTDQADPAVTLRPASAEDCRMLWEWANDPATREASFDTAPIALPVHEAWLAQKLAAPECDIFIALDSDSHPVGVIRFELKGADAVVSITVAPPHRGKGYASRIIRAG